MQRASSLTVVAAFASVTANAPTRPLITHYDDATGERTELSAATLGNWVAKTANLLTDGLGLGHGDVAAVALPAHWQTAAVLLGCWSAGLSVRLAGPAAPGAGPVVTGDVGFAAADRVAEVAAPDVFALALAPLAAPLRPGPPAGTVDYVVEVRGHGDAFPARTVAPVTTAYADGTTHADLIELATDRRMPAHSRVLIDGDVLTDPVSWLVAPLLAGSSVVLCRNLDPARVPDRLATERAVPYPG